MNRRQSIKVTSIGMAAAIIARPVFALSVIDGKFKPPFNPPPSSSASEALAHVERATELIQEYPQSFCFGYVRFNVSELKDMRMVIERLREYGNHDAWRDAQKFQKCL